MQSHIPGADASDFSIHNLPFGIFTTTAHPQKRVGVAIGDQIIDLVQMAEKGYFQGITSQNEVFSKPFLNDFMRLGKKATQAVRLKIQAELTDAQSGVYSLLTPQKDAQLHLPIEIGDYTDFYSSIDHATNVGKMFRDPANALLPNWRHIPVGYHGRASSVVVSGTPIRRPHGQVLPKGSETPVFQASARLDFELEMAFVIGKDSALGEPIGVNETDDYIFGLMLFNDWSARDIQQWEYVPLGPFLGKNFGSSLSPWVVTMEALEPFRFEGSAQEPLPMSYLQSQGAQHYDIPLEVAITPENGVETVVSRSNFKYMYWNMAQQLAHHTVNGCNVRVGDLLASGTISGPEPGSFGSMLELAWMGTQPIPMADGTERIFIRDGDTVTMRGTAEKDGIRVGFGEVNGQIQPAK